MPSYILLYISLSLLENWNITPYILAGYNRYSFFRSCNDNNVMKMIHIAIKFNVHGHRYWWLLRIFWTMMNQGRSWLIMAHWYEEKEQCRFSLVYGVCTSSEREYLWIVQPGKYTYSGMSATRWWIQHCLEMMYANRRPPSDSLCRLAG